MIGAERQPILDTLSVAEKDALILRLWDDLREARTRLAELDRRLSETAGGTSAGPAAPTATTGLLAELQKHGTDKRRPAAASSAVKVRLGRGLGSFWPRALFGAAALAALVFALDAAMTWYQHYRLQQKRLADLQLTQAAYAGLYVDLVKVAYEPDRKSYRLTMTMQNLDPAHPIYVMQSPVRVYEQSGLTWREVPARAPNGASTTVVKLTDKKTYETIFEPNLKDWTELIPGYMHIRFESTSLISQRSEPDDDIIDRRDRYYVYLKPHDADDEAIRKRMKYAGAPPVYIPMPPH